MFPINTDPIAGISNLSQIKVTKQDTFHCQVVPLQITGNLLMFFHLIKRQ